MGFDIVPEFLKVKASNTEWTEYEYGDMSLHYFIDGNEVDYESYSTEFIERTRQ